MSHLRDGLYANPSPQWRDWNERYYRAVELAAAARDALRLRHGPPGSRDRHDRPARRGRRRPAAPRRRGLEAPNEFDKYVGGRALAGAARRLRPRALPQGEGDPACARCPSSARRSPRWTAAAGSATSARWLDGGNIHPYTGGLLARPRSTSRPSWRARERLAGSKPVWATEAGFHNAMSARSGQPAVSERVAAVYLLRTFLEHFRSGIPRTYAYELLDEKPERAGRDPEQHFGLLRNDFSRKPAFTALQNLLDRRRPGRAPPRCARSAWGCPAPRDLRRLVLQKRRRHLRRRALAARPAPGTATAGARCAWHRGA